MGKFNFKRFTALCLGILSLVVCIYYAGALKNPGLEYTEAYEVYSDLKQLSLLTDVESYLDNKDIAYEIEDSKLTTDTSSSVVYIINPDNKTGYIEYSPVMHNLSKLDERNLDVVDVEREYINDVLKESVFLKRNGITYTKLDNHYYAKPTLFYAILFIVGAVASIIILPSVISEYIGVFFDWLKVKKKKNKKLKKEDSNSNDEAKNVETEKCES